MSDYEVEAVDRLPFTTPEKSQRYRTDNYREAVGLNWFPGRAGQHCLERS